MPERIFIDWSQPFLPEVARRLVQEHSGDQGPIDLGRVAIIAPGARAGRLLLHALVTAAGDWGRPLIPPRIITPGGMAEALAGAGCAIATRAECVLAWAAALRDAPGEDLAALLPETSLRNDPLAVLEIAALLQALDEELAGAGVGCDAITAAIEQMGVPGEAERWRAIARLRDAAHDHLNAAGLADPIDVLRASGIRTEVSAQGTLVLAGITDLARVQADLVRAVEARGCAVIAFIQAPHSRASGFDDLGCVIAEAWRDEGIEIDDGDLRVADRPRDQVQATLAEIARLEGALSADEVAIGLGDESLATSLRRAALRVGLEVHVAAGDRLGDSRPATLLALLAEWISDRSFSRLAALVRHTDLERFLDEQARGAGAAPGDRLSRLDRCFSEYLYERLDDDSIGSGPRAEAVEAIGRAMHMLAGPLLGAPRPLGDWMPGVIAVLHAVYEDIALEGAGEGERRLSDACRAIVDVCSETARVPQRLQFECSGADAIRSVLALVRAESRPQPVRAGQVEALGWLELRFDPARAVIVTGFNEGAIPSSMSADAFLPDSLRATLGLRDNTFRYARDLYVFEAMRRGRERVVVICGRRNAVGEPLLPSRFLLAGDRATLPARALRLADGARASCWDRPLGSPAAGRASRFVRPEAPPGPLDLPRLSVTQFKRYLECPFRFWLACVRRLDEAGDDKAELDPRSFGSLAHEVLREFGRDESIRDATDADAIAAYLDSRLRAAVGARFGPRPAATVRVQAARLQQRLDSFARLQARLRGRGWRIHACEFALPAEAALALDNDAPMPVTGTIDRIDRHDELGVMLIDYKTGEAGDDPRSAHGPTSAGEWIDLQLPLYHHLYCGYVDRTVSGNRVRLAYITLPKKADDVDLRVAEWDEQELESALEAARTVVAGIRAGKFAPKDVRPDHDPFAIICQTTAFASAAADEAERPFEE